MLEALNVGGLIVALGLGWVAGVFTRIGKETVGTDDTFYKYTVNGWPQESHDMPPEDGYDPGSLYIYFGYALEE